MDNKVVITIWVLLLFKILYTQLIKILSNQDLKRILGLLMRLKIIIIQC